MVRTRTAVIEHATPMEARGEPIAFPGESGMSSDLKFAVLGPVLAWRGNTALGVGGAAAGGGAVAGVIDSAGADYVLSAPAGALDLDVFARLTQDARRERASAPAGMAKAAALLRDALELGQGTPLAGVPGPYAESQRVRIIDLQLAATEERLALDIELGGHVAAAAELRSLLASHPTRERFSELLMLRASR